MRLSKRRSASYATCPASCRLPRTTGATWPLNCLRAPLTFSSDAGSISKKSCATPSASWSTNRTCGRPTCSTSTAASSSWRSTGSSSSTSAASGGRDLCQQARRRHHRHAAAHLDERVGDAPASRTWSKPPRIALLAVGGFGRGELNPYSDIDILFLHPTTTRSTTAQVNDIVQHVLYMLWDIGFQVGHATRTMAELVTQANGDLRTKTSLLEARFLCGDEALFAEFEKTFERRCLHGHEKEFLEWRVADQADRHAKAGNTRLPAGAEREERLRRPARLPEPDLGRPGEARAAQHAGVRRRAAAHRLRAQAARPRLRFPAAHPHRAALPAKALRRRPHPAPAGPDRRQLRLPAPHHPAPHGGLHARLLRAHLAALQPGQHALRPALRRTAPGASRAGPSCRFHATHRRGDRRLHARERRAGGRFARHLRRRAAAARARLPARPAAQRRPRRRAEDAPAPPPLHGRTGAFIYQTAVRETLLAIFSRKGQVGHALRTMHELGFLGRLLPGIPAPHLPRAARVLPSLHRGRAHAGLHRDARPDHRRDGAALRRSTSRCCSRSRGRTFSTSPCCCTTRAGRTTPRATPRPARSTPCAWRAACSSPAPISPRSSFSSTITSPCRRSRGARTSTTRTRSSSSPASCRRRSGSTCSCC